MLVAIHQLHYLPWLRYFDKIARADVFIVLDDIQFNKNGWQNRNKIKGPNGALLLTVPVHARLGQDLDAIGIDNSKCWARKHWNSIRQCYGKAPFFHELAPFLEDAYSRSWNCLNALNRHMMGFFVEWMGIDTPILYSSALDVPGTATERLVNLIRAARGDRYYSGAYALDAYLDAERLREAGIGLEPQDWRAPVYPQRHKDFVPDLSVLDLLMNCGPHSLDVLMRRTDAPQTTKEIAR